MLAAIVPTDARDWFFKMVGPAGKVENQVDAFRSLIESVTFETPASDPKWKLPEGWTAQPSGGMRFATLKTDDADVSVISLPAGQDVNANIDRWRGQLRLPPQTDEPERLKIGEYEAVLVDLVGKADASKMMSGAPFAGGGAASTAVAPATRPTSPPAAGEAEFKFEQPATWTAGRSGGMRKAAFNVEHGVTTAEVTVITLPGNVGGPLNNINRWREQIGLSSIDEPDMPTATTPIDVGGLDALLVDLVGPDGPEQQSMLAVMLMRDGTSWFFKLMGPAELVAAEQENFVAFVKSVRFGD